MSHAEAVHTLQPAAGATQALIAFNRELRYDAIPEEARHYAKRHLLDTVGVMIAGAPGTIATSAEKVVASVRPAGKIPVPGRARRADLLDAAFLGGTAAHGIELDDGYRNGSAHCGCVVVPTILSVGYERRASGAALIEAMVAGYETNISLARACAPDLRHRGFHPTSAVGPFGAAMATAKLRALPAGKLGNALGIAASSAAGLFAFVNGGGDIKRLHAGHASREGMQAALLAEQGVEGPPNVIESRDGFMQAFAFGRIDKARPITLPPQAEYGITDCYIKPYACCRHIQPAVEAAFGLLNDENISFEDIKKVDVETYKIAAEHAHVPWDDFASAQLELSVPDGPRGALPRHQVRTLRREDPQGSGVRRVLAQAHDHRANGDRSALSEAAPSPRHRAHVAGQVRPPGRRGLGLAHRSARRRRPDRQVPRSRNAGLWRGARQGAVRAAVEY